MRGLTSTIIATVVLAGLLGYIYFVDAKRPPGGAEERETAFTAVEEDRIEELRITAAGGETARLVKGESGWQMVEPAKAEADATEMSSITSSLSALEVERVVDENPADLAQYGLDPPRVDVAFRLQGDTEFRRLLIGEKTPAGGDLYARRQDGNAVFLIASYLDNTFNRTPFDLRDKRVLRFDRDNADSLEIASGGSTLRLAKEGEQWRVVEPIAARGDFGVIEALVTRLSSARMQRIVETEPESLQQYGLARPDVTATVGAGSSRATLALGSTKDGEVYGRDASRPLVFAVEESLITELRKDAADLRRQDVFDFRSYNASRVEIARGGETLVFEKAKDEDGTEAWRAAGGQEADTAKVEDAVTRLSNLRAERFQPARPAGLAAAELSVTVTFDEGRSETVQFARAGDGVFATRADDAGYAAIESTAYGNAVEAVDALR